MGGATVAKRPGWCWLAEGDPTIIITIILLLLYQIWFDLNNPFVMQADRKGQSSAEELLLSNFTFIQKV